MSQPRSIYKTDFVPFDWMENNFTTNSDDFCSPDNIDDCVQYISQECCALGYPAIYVTSNSCQFAVNCDIVNLLNITFDLLGSSRDHIHAKEDLECRNKRLSADLTSLSKKNFQLKESSEQLERKYRSVLERERQLKEKNEQLQQAIKNEKDEAKKLSSQMQQQKVAYQHEVRKCESNMNQMKGRLKQLLSDKNPDKKVASISSTSLLPRNNKERGKWKTEATAKSCVEDMYNTLISSYEKRCQDMLKDISDYHNCLEFIESEMKKLVTEFKDAKKEDVAVFEVPLCMIWNGPNKVKELTERFRSLLCEIKNSCLKYAEENVKKFDEEINFLKSRLAHCEKLLQECENTPKVECSSHGEGHAASSDNSMQDQESQRIELTLEKEKLNKEKLELSATVTLIEKEKVNLEAQKLDMIKIAMQQDVPKSQWHGELKSVPSFSVITTKAGLTAAPTTAQLKQCLSEPDQQLKNLHPLWSMGHSKVQKVKSDDKLMSSSRHELVPSSLDKVQKDINTESLDLPKWASSCRDSVIELSESRIESSESISNDDLNLSNISSSSEDQNLSLLQAAMKDIENRRNNPSS